MDVIQSFIESAKANELTYTLAQEALDKLKEDYTETVNKGNCDARREFYNRYIEFAKTCQSLSTLGGVSGYGGIKDYEKLRIKDICRCVDYYFPYGWK